MSKSDETQQSEREAVSYAWGVLRSKNPECDNPEEVVRLAGEILGERKIGDLDYDDLDDLAFQVAKKWRAKHSLSGDIEAQRREIGIDW